MDWIRRFAVLALPRRLNNALRCALMCAPLAACQGGDDTAGSESAAVPPVITQAAVPAVQSLGAPLQGSFLISDANGDTLQQLRVTVGRSPDASDCVIAVGSSDGPQAAGVQSFSGCAALTATAGVLYVQVQGRDSTGLAANTVRLTVPVLPQAPRVNDTGVGSDRCLSAEVVTASPGYALSDCSAANAKALSTTQDGMLGRDARLPSTSDGRLGFSFAAVGTDCVADQVSGLTWAMPTPDGGPTGRDSLVGHAEATAYLSVVNAARRCGFSDWRLPSTSELLGLVDYSVPYGRPTIDAVWFPQVRAQTYWTGEAALSPRGGHHYVHLFIGEASHGDEVLQITTGRYGRARLLLVRGAPAAEGTRWAPLVDANGLAGEMLDTDTGLIWRRCPEGNTWDGQRCTGGDPLVFQSVASAFAAAGVQATRSGQAWRLPNVKELDSLVDRQRYQPAIDPAAFPGAPSACFLSSTPWIDNTLPSPVFNVEAKTMGVSFEDGFVFRAGGLPCLLRLVRSALP